MSTVTEQADANMQALSENAYPGRGIVIGMTPDATRCVQVYWIMGRSDNSRNRVFVADGDLVRTAPFDASKVEDPSLIIYNCVRSAGRAHVVTNGDQTDTIIDAIDGGGTFEDAIRSRTFEPDAPNYTARISGLTDLDAEGCAYKLAIIKAVGGSGEHCARQVFGYGTSIPGVGHCVTTYAGDGSPLPCFEGEPYPLPLVNCINGTARIYWQALNEDNKISLLVKTIRAETGETDLRIVNKHGQGGSPG